MTNSELRERLLMELFTHLCEEDQEHIISVIISILSRK